jgi:hypothetical protein
MRAPEERQPEKYNDEHDERETDVNVGQDPDRDLLVTGESDRRPELHARSIDEQAVLTAG